MLWSSLATEAALENEGVKRVSSAKQVGQQISSILETQLCLVRPLLEGMARRRREQGNHNNTKNRM